MDRTPFRVNWDLCVLCQGENKMTSLFHQLIVLEEIVD